MSPIVLDLPRTPPSISMTVAAPIVSSLGRAQLEPIVPTYSAAPWLPSLLTHLRQFESEGRNITGVGDFTIASSTADRIRRLLAIAQQNNIHLPEPHLSTFSGGGLALIWNTDDRELTFTAYPDANEFLFANTNENDEVIERGVLPADQTNELFSVVSTFLNAARR